MKHVVLHLGILPNVQTCHVSVNIKRSLAVNLPIQPNHVKRKEPILNVNMCLLTIEFSFYDQRSNLSKNLHRRNFRPKLLHRQFQLISTVLVMKTQKNEWKWRNLHRWQKFYTVASSDGMYKSHLWSSSLTSSSIIRKQPEGGANILSS